MRSGCCCTSWRSRRRGLLSCWPCGRSSRRHTDRMDLGQLVLVLGTEALYLRALRVLQRRGVGVPAPQIVFWHIGIALWAIGFFSPVHSLGDELLSAHMAQHLLI